MRSLKHNVTITFSSEAWASEAAKLATERFLTGYRTGGRSMCAENVGRMVTFRAATAILKRRISDWAEGVLDAAKRADAVAGREYVRQLPEGLHLVQAPQA